MVRDRLQLPARFRGVNPAVSPAVESIVQHCLEAEPSRRYQTARELQEDLERHLKNLSLCRAREPSVRERTRKWIRRHPAVDVGREHRRYRQHTSSLALGTAFVFHTARLSRLEAGESFNQFQEDLRTAQVGSLDAADLQRATQLKVITAACRRAVTLQILDNSSWQATTFGICSGCEAERVRRGCGRTPVPDGGPGPAGSRLPRAGESTSPRGFGT